MGLFHHQSASLPLRSLGTLSSIEVAAIQGRPQHQNITTWAPWIGEVALLQDYHSVPYVQVQ